MEISATVANQDGRHQSMVRTGDKAQSLGIPAKAEGFGSAVNGGELLFLALATCYCNDIYREAKTRGINVESVEGSGLRPVRRSGGARREHHLSSIGQSTRKRKRSARSHALYGHCCGDTQYAEAHHAGGTHRMPGHPNEAERIRGFEQVSERATGRQ